MSASQKGTTVSQVQVQFGSGWNTEGEALPDHSQRQERILSLVQDVWDVGFLSDSKKLSVAVDSKEDNLVDGMGFEPTTPTLRTWCSPN